MNLFKQNRVAVTLCTAIILIAATYTAINFFDFANSKAAGISSVYTVIIDAGHGGFDPGAVCNQIEEKAINLQISSVLADVFRINGFKVIVSRDRDMSLETEGNTTAQRKKSDMYNRLRLMQQNKDAIFLCIHQNSYGGASSGSQVFYSQNSPLSEQLAANIQQSIKSSLQPLSNRLHKPAGDRYYLMRKAEIPAVLVECGFISDPVEAKLLQDQEYQMQLCICIYNGVCEYLNINHM